jgi:hypothetical protein
MVTETEDKEAIFPVVKRIIIEGRNMTERPMGNKECKQFLLGRKKKVSIKEKESKQKFADQSETKEKTNEETESVTTKSSQDKQCMKKSVKGEMPPNYTKIVSEPGCMHLAYLGPSLAQIEGSAECMEYGLRIFQ